MSGCHGVAGRQLLPPQTQLIIEIRIIWHCDPAQSAAQQPSSRNLVSILETILYQSGNRKLMLKITYLAWPAPGAPSVIRYHRRMAGWRGAGAALTSRHWTRALRRHIALVTTRRPLIEHLLLLPAPLQAGSIYILEI